MTAPRLEGNGVVLHGLRDDDLVHITAYATSPGFFDHIDVPDRLRRDYDRQDAQAFLQEATRGWAAGYPTWAIELGGRFGGTIRLRRAAWHDGDEVGFGLAPAARGGGAANRALDLVMGWCSSQGRALPWARCKVQNLPSARVLQRCGFREDRHEGEWICWRPPM